MQDDGPSRPDGMARLDQTAGGPVHPWREVGPPENPVLRVIRVILCLPLAILRIGIWVVCIVGVILALYSGPLQACFLGFFGRLMLVACGVWPGLLVVHGKPNPAAPIVVTAPHAGMLDGMIFLAIAPRYGRVPHPVAMESYTKIPIFGQLFRQAGGIPVPGPQRKKEPANPDGASSREKETAQAAPKEATKEAFKSSATAIREKIAQHVEAFKEGDPPIVLFPEGTTQNGHSLCKFFSGGFVVGAPVQPVVLSYPGSRAAWFSGGLVDHILRLLFTPYIRQHVTFCDMYVPTEADNDPDAFAENVRATMGRVAQLPLSSYGARELVKEMKAAKAANQSA